jgi:diadenosine tetraphosphate (Ap4A) HIT family hydrolase
MGEILRDSGITNLFIHSFQDNEYVVFPDIRPAAKHHYLIVTREHIQNAKQLTTEHRHVGK